MRRVIKTVTGAGVSAWLPVDFNNLPPNIGFAVVISATATYTVEYTYDDIQNALVTPTAFPSATVTAATANKDGSFLTPIAAIRLNVASSTGTATITILSGLKG